MTYYFYIKKIVILNYVTSIWRSNAILSNKLKFAQFRNIFEFLKKKKKDVINIFCCTKKLMVLAPGSWCTSPPQWQSHIARAPVSVEFWPSLLCCAVQFLRVRPGSCQRRVLAVFVVLCCPIFTGTTFFSLGSEYIPFLFLRF